MPRRTMRALVAAGLAVATGIGCSGRRQTTAEVADPIDTRLVLEDDPDSLGDPEPAMVGFWQDRPGEQAVELATAAQTGEAVLLRADGTYVVSLPGWRLLFGRWDVTAGQLRLLEKLVVTGTGGGMGTDGHLLGSICRVRPSEVTGLQTRALGECSGSEAERGTNCRRFAGRVFYRVVPADLFDEQFYRRGCRHAPAEE